MSVAHDSELHVRFRRDLACGFYQHGYTAHGQKPLPIFADVCLIDALRALGFKVRYTCGGKFWALADGNRMLEPFGRKLDSIKVLRFGIHGKYVLHLNGHFFALKMYDEYFTLISRKKDGLASGTKADLDILLANPDITIWRLEHKSESRALQNYESYYGLIPGQGSLNDVSATCAGVSGWAGAIMETLSDTHVQIDKIGGAQRSVAGGVEDPNATSMQLSPQLVFPRPAGRPRALSPPMPPDAAPPPLSATPSQPSAMAPPPEPVFPRLARRQRSRASSSRVANEVAPDTLRCKNCDKQGHADNTDRLCPFFGRNRDPHRDAEQGTGGSAPHMDQINAERVDGGFLLDGTLYREGRGVVGAPHTPEQNNCLIDSLRQCLSEALGSHFYCNRNLVRADLQVLYPPGCSYEVTFSSFLDVTAHGVVILRSLFANTTSHRHVAFDAPAYCIIALSRDLVANGVVVGNKSAPHRLVVLNTGGNTHFNPLLKMASSSSGRTHVAATEDVQSLKFLPHGVVPEETSEVDDALVPAAIVDRHVDRDLIYDSLHALLIGSDVTDERLIALRAITSTLNVAATELVALHIDTAWEHYLSGLPDFVRETVVGMKRHWFSSNCVEVLESFVHPLMPQPILVPELLPGDINDAKNRESAASIFAGVPGEGSELGTEPDLHFEPPLPHPVKKRQRIRLRKKTSMEDTNLKNASESSALQCDKRLPKSKVTSAAVDSAAKVQASNSSLDVAMETHFFSIRCKDAKDTHDQRCTKELAISKLSDLLRAIPTLPCDPKDSNEPWGLALREDSAVQLPAKHCSFRGCVWEGDTQTQLVEHLCTSHVAVLSDAANAYSNIFSDEERLYAAYNAAVTAKVQAGSPVASYAIDRRCMYLGAL